MCSKIGPPLLQKEGVWSERLARRPFASRDWLNEQPQGRQHSAASWRDAGPAAPASGTISCERSLNGRAATRRISKQENRCAITATTRGGDLAGRNRFSGRGKPPVYLIASIADFVSATMHGFEHRLWQRPSRVPITNSSGYVGGQINRACFQGRPVISAPRGFAAFAVHVAPSTWRCSPYRHSDHSTGLPVRIWPYRFRTHMFGQMSPK